MHSPAFEIIPDDFLRRFTLAANAAGFSVVQYGDVGGFPLLAAENFSNRTTPAILRVYISAGIHGDEPAGSLALLELMRRRWFSQEIAWHILPLLNPRGMAAGTRETPDGIDLNRDYRHECAPETSLHKTWLNHENRRYDVTLSLHEDWEMPGFYLYEVRGANMPTLGEAILRTVAPVISAETAREIDGFPAQNGLIRPHVTGDNTMPETWPEQLFLREKHTALSLTFETPSSDLPAKRILAQIVALTTAVNLLLAPKVEDFYEI